MRKSGKLIGMFMLAMSMFVSTESRAEIVSDFAAFDRAFIPPLAITQQEKVKPAKKAMKILNEQWATFKTQYADGNGYAPGWKDAFAEADRLIKTTEEIVRGETRLMEAHETLESVRILFKELRRKNGIEYFPDHLTEFHEYMEAIFHGVSEKASDTLTRDDIYDLGNTLSEGLQAWEKVRTAPFDAAVFGFDETKTQKRASLIKGETDALIRFQKALSGNDNAEIIAAGMAIKPPYAQLYKLFGDFEPIMGK